MMIAMHIDTQLELSRLIKGCSLRDERCWVRFIRSYGPIINSISKKLAGSEADDLAQRVFIRLSENNAAVLARFDGPEPAFLVYLQRIVYNLFRDFSRERKRQREVVCDPLKMAEELSFCGNAVEQRLVDEETLVSLSEVLSRLDERYRSILLLLIRGYKHREISDMLSIPVSTCLARARRGRIRLRALLVSQDDLRIPIRIGKRKLQTKGDTR